MSEDTSEAVQFEFECLARGTPLAALASRLVEAYGGLEQKPRVAGAGIFFYIRNDIL